LVFGTEGASAVEYGVLIALIAAVIILAVQNLGSTMNTSFTNVNSLISSSISGDGGGSCCD
jgi:pilus assembly protein Flp/PilA